MVALVLCFGVLIAVAGVFLLLKPDTVFGVMEDQAGSRWLYAAAVGARLLLGLLLLRLAVQSRFPLTIEVLGWIAVAAAVILALLGPRRFGRLLRWVVARFRPFARPAGVLALAFGAFLFYAFA